MLKTTTSLNRGTSSERNLVLKLLKEGIQAGAIFRDIYIKKPNGKFAQIDLVFPMRAGIIVFEVKDYSGLIFGDDRHNQWTKILVYGQENIDFTIQ